MSDAFVSLSDLTLAYGESIAVPNLNLDIQQGELIALLGPSGCGKTTTMRAIAGLMPAKSGTITIDGRDVTRVPANKRGIGLVFQSYALFPHLSAFENAAFGLRLQRRPESDIRSRTQAALEIVGLAHLAARKPSEMSGGQQQRLALARSLVMEPKVLLLDEPLSNLDARLRLEMRTELQRLQRETGITMVFVTHDQSEALALADRVVLMRDGVIEQIGPPDSLYNTPVTAFAADFMGFENIFAVEGTSLSSDQGALAVSYGADAPFLGWRPGAVRLGSGSHEARVRSVAFAGGHREYVLDTQIGPVRADVDIAAPVFAVDDAVMFDLPQETAHPLKAS
ncbi:MAG: ABC transporter ATP-binding protein [Pseudomonadota bacterium]